MGKLDIKQRLRNAAWQRLAAMYAKSSPQLLLITWFLAQIAAGTGLLLLPWCHVPGRVRLLDALFTSTSATCVTGLTVVDTGTDFTVAGQWVILGLIQVGGLGIMTFAAVSFRLLGLRFPLTSQAALDDSWFQQDMASTFRGTFRRILVMVVSIEAMGALCLFAGFARNQPPRHALQSAVFHSVSAFCNAGFSIYSDNLEGFKTDPLILLTVMVLIVLGGLGHTVILELCSGAARMVRRSHSETRLPLSLHAKVVLVLSGGLIVAGTLGFYVAGMNSEHSGAGADVVTALFQSVTARTAGFNTVPVGPLPLSSLLLLIILMFIGGSPGSCAGGVKTTSVAILFARLRADLLGHTEVTLAETRMPDPLVRKTNLLLWLSVLWIAVGVLLLSISEKAGLSAIVFEQVSAFGTVGLSAGLTPHLSAFGQGWIIASMFIGRVGPLTLAFLLAKQRHQEIHYPEGRLMIG